MRRCLIRQLLRWRHERGVQWLRGYVDGWGRWDALKGDFADQWRKGNRGETDDWRE
ncbi:MAG: hypothetical protein Q4F13_02700 [Pseudomonadota bacterium]|nr:hypothetical protein [Pseudomonadota bacterium]